MVLTRLMGGFGNQLFQYAAGRALAERNGEELLLDTSWFQQDPGGAYTRRSFQLSQILYKGRLATGEEISPFSKQTVYKKIMNRLGWSAFQVINEREGELNRSFFEARGNILLNGYWQDERYFSSARPHLLDEIRPSYEFTGEGKRMKEIILGKESVAVHVRRGDYISLPSASQFHGFCGAGYYERALSYLNAQYPDLHFFVFSDDIAWCKKHLRFGGPASFAEPETGKQDSQDLFLMRECKHHVIANSSYSWWSAWLSQAGGTIIAPDRWFAAQNRNICPEHWVKLNSNETGS